MFIDAGIASKDNIALLKEKEFSYIVVSRSNQEAILSEDFVEIKAGVKAKCIQQGDEVSLHCVSEGKMKKEKVMVAKARSAMAQELKSLAEGLNKKGCVKVYPKNGSAE